MPQTITDELNGQLLIAMPGMGDPRFHKAVIFICSHSADGTMGVVINHPHKKLGFNDLANGVLYLTGGEIEPDMKKLAAKSNTYDLSDHFTEGYFATKKVVHIYNF